MKRFCVFRTEVYVVKMYCSFKARILIMKMFYLFTTQIFGLHGRYSGCILLKRCTNEAFKSVFKLAERVDLA